MPEISVIVPVYKVEKHLDKCVNSIVNQTFTDIEIILVDDGSPDSCPALCDSWAEKDARITAIHKKNGGLSSARNAGLDAMSGKYVYFVDSDDEIVPETLELLYNLIIENDCDMSFGRFLRVYETGNNEKDTPDFSGKSLVFDEDSFWEYYYSCYSDGARHEISVSMVVAWNKLVKKSVFTDLRFSEGKIHEDEFIIHKLIANCKRTVFIDVELYLYYQNPSGIMADKSIHRAAFLLDAMMDRTIYFASKGKTYTFRAFEIYDYLMQNELAKPMCDSETRARLHKLYRSTYKYVKPFLKDTATVNRLLYLSVCIGPCAFKLTKSLLSAYKKVKG